LVVLDYLPTPLSVHAKLFIPTSTPVEAAGTYINKEGRQQLLAPVIEPRLPIAVTGDGNHPPREFIQFAPGSEPQPAWQLLQQLLGDSAQLDVLRHRMKETVPRLVDFSKLEPGGVSCRVSDADERSLYADEIPDQPQGSLQLLVSPARYGSDLLSRFSDKLTSRFPAARLQLHPQDAAERGLGDGNKVILDTDIGTFNLTLSCVDGLAQGCALVENSAAFPHLVPGGKIGFCQVAAGGSHD